MLTNLVEWSLRFFKHQCVKIVVFHCSDIVSIPCVEEASSTAARGRGRWSAVVVWGSLNGRFSEHPTHDGFLIQLRKDQARSATFGCMPLDVDGY